MKSRRTCFYIFFFFNDTATTEIYTLSLHDALPISPPILGREFYVERTHVLFEIPAMLRSRNGHDIFALRQHPGQRQLRRLNALLFCDFSHPPHQIKILLEILSLKTGRLPPVIVRSEEHTSELQSQSNLVC